MAATRSRTPKGRLCDHLRAVLREMEGLRPGRARSLDEIVDTFGSRRALYAYIAGTGDVSSAAYKAASRRVRRYLQGTRRPSPEFLRKLRGGATRRAAVERKAERRRRLVDMGERVELFAKFEVSKDTRRRRVRGFLDTECWERIAELLADDLCDEAEEEFQTCFGRRNGFGDVPVITEVEYLDVAS